MAYGESADNEEPNHRHQRPMIGGRSWLKALGRTGLIPGQGGIKKNPLKAHGRVARESGCFSPAALRATLSCQSCERPPSTAISWPVIKEAAGLQRKAIT